MKARQQPLPFSDLPQLHLETQGCVVELVGLNAGEQPMVEVEGPALRIDAVDGVLKVQPEFGMGDHRLRFHVPQNLKATIGCDMGKLKVRQLAGCDLNLSTNAGSLELNDVRGRLTMRAHAGEIRGETIGGTLEVEASTGSVRLSVVALDPGTHRIRSTMGSVRVELVPGLDVHLESRTVMGSTRTRYPSNPQAAAKLLLEAELGSVKVRERSAIEDERHGDWPDWRRWWASAARSVFPLEWPVGQGGGVGGDFSSPRAAPAASSDSPELLKVLSMVEKGTLTAEQADRLIRAIKGTPATV